MKLIGITGMAGSGKSTFSNMLGENSNVGVIHIDDILKEFKLKYFKPFMKKDKNDERTKVDSRLKAIIYSNKIVFSAFMKFRAALISRTLENKIEEYRKENKDIVVIDDIFLKYHKCYKRLNNIVSIKRPYIERREALRKRDKLTKKEVIAYDMAHRTSNYKDDIFKVKCINLKNAGKIEDLRKKAEKFYKLISPQKEDIRDKVKVKERGKTRDDKCNGQVNKQNKRNKQSNSNRSRS